MAEDNGHCSTCQVNDTITLDCRYNKAQTFCSTNGQTVEDNEPYLKLNSLFPSVVQGQQIGPDVINVYKDILLYIYNYGLYGTRNPNLDNLSFKVLSEEKNIFMGTKIKGTSTIRATKNSATDFKRDINFDIITFNSDNINIPVGGPNNNNTDFNGSYDSYLTNTTSQSLFNLGNNFFILLPGEINSKTSSVSVGDEYNNTKTYGIIFRVAKSSPPNSNYIFGGNDYITTITDGEADPYCIQLSVGDSKLWICRKVNKNFLLGEEIETTEEKWYPFWNDRVSSGEKALLTSYNNLLTILSKTNLSNGSLFTKAQIDNLNTYIKQITLNSDRCNVCNIAINTGGGGGDSYDGGCGTVYDSSCYSNPYD